MWPAQIRKERADTPVFRAEREHFLATVADSGRWTFGARIGAHNDLVPAPDKLPPNSTDGATGQLTANSTIL